MKKINDTVIRERKASLILRIRKDLPQLTEAVKVTGDNFLLLHQDAFAADYQEDEYTLLGMAIKYCGLVGKEIRIIGTNSETINK